MSAPRQQRLESLERARSSTAYTAAGGLTRRAREQLPGLPVALRAQGLLATLATVEASVALALVEWLADWGELLLPELQRGASKSTARFGEAYTRLDASTAAALTAEAIRFANQLKLVAKLSGR